MADAALQRPWRKGWRLSTLANTADAFLDAAGFDRGPWLAVAFLAGISSWFVLGYAWQWATAIAIALMVALVAAILWREKEHRTHVQLAAIALALCFAGGLSVIWARSSIVGAPAIERPMVLRIDARVLDRIEQPADDRVRLLLAVREADTGRAMKVRVNLPIERDDPRLAEGAVIRLRMRLMPPASPMLPGGYDFARAAWFQGLAATGSVIGPVAVLQDAERDGSAMARIQRRLSAHVRAQLRGSAGNIAAAFASGDRGAIATADEDAMRDAGLTHLLSISGLHVSAVIAAAYLVALRLLALWPWLALRTRLPVVAAGVGAGAGIFYTLLTGAEVPTVRSCVGAVLVLIALALGREPLSIRMVAVAAFVILLLWPEAAAGPSFQMSFAAVVAIVALHNSAPVKAFLAPREERWSVRTGRRLAMLLITGIVIEFALMPIGLYHFHRAGAYGAFANVVAIPLTTFVSMPLIALALLCDTIGLGAPVWWLVGQSLDLLLWIAHWTAGQPGAVTRMPGMSEGTFLLFVAGSMWLALWRGRTRLGGFVPIALGVVLLMSTPVPDILISNDGRHVGITNMGPRLLVLRDTKSSFTRDNLLELAGMEGVLAPIADWPGARCSRDFCALDITRGGRIWRLLMARNRERIDELQLAAACERADIVIADRWLPRSCKPRWLKADGRFLTKSGGLAIRLGDQSVRSVAQNQGDHGWWRARTSYRNTSTDRPSATHQ